MTKKVDSIAFELACRAVATRHYANRFNKPENDPHVQLNVSANWNIFAGDAKIAIEEYLKHAS